MQKNVKMSNQKSGHMMKLFAQQKNIICITYRQGIILKNLKKKHNFSKMIKYFRVSKPTMIFKNNS